MGKTQQPLTIWAPKEWRDKPEVQALIAKGHTVLDLDGHGVHVDLILHPAACAWDDSMWPMLEVTLKAARARRYPPKKEKKK